MERESCSLKEPDNVTTAIITLLRALKKCKSTCLVVQGKLVLHFLSIMEKL